MLGSENKFDVVAVLHGYDVYCFSNLAVMLLLFIVLFGVFRDLVSFCNSSLMFTTLLFWPMHNTSVIIFKEN